MYPIVNQGAGVVMLPLWSLRESFLASSSFWCSQAFLGSNLCLRVHMAFFSVCLYVLWGHWSLVLGSVRIIQDDLISKPLITFAKIVFPHKVSLIERICETYLNGDHRSIHRKGFKYWYFREQGSSLTGFIISIIANLQQFSYMKPWVILPNSSHVMVLLCSKPPVTSHFAQSKFQSLYTGYMIWSFYQF